MWIGQPAYWSGTGSMSLRPSARGCAAGMRFRLIPGSCCTLTRSPFRTPREGSGVLAGGSRGPPDARTRLTATASPAASVSAHAGHGGVPAGSRSRDTTREELEPAGKVEHDRGSCPVCLICLLAPGSSVSLWVPETLSRRLTWRLVLGDGGSRFSVWLREGHAVGHLQYSCNYDSRTSQLSGSSAGSPCSPAPTAPGTWRS